MSQQIPPARNAAEGQSRDLVPDGAAMDTLATDPKFMIEKGHPPGLFLLFVVEMWERFSYYGMRALLVPYLIHAMNSWNAGRGWPQGQANYLYGWYTGLVYLFPLLGGYLADKFLGTHRSMVVGAVLITLGHIVLGVSGVGDLSHSDLGLTTFIGGLALIVVGTGYFKPCVSVMVGQLYPPNDPRRDGAFTIFYMGINVGAFLCAFVVGTLGELVGWHVGFAAAAVGMILGLGTYLIFRPMFLRGVGLPPAGQPNTAPLFFVASLALVGAFTALYHVGVISDIAGGIDSVTENVIGGLALAAVVIGLSVWLILIQRPGERGQVASIFISMLFNAFFWIAFEQAGSTLNVFAFDNTDLTNTPLVSGLVALVPAVFVSFLSYLFLRFYYVRESNGRPEGLPRSAVALIALVPGLVIGIVVYLLLYVYLPTIPATWFQSVNPLLIVAFAPLFAVMWTALGRRRMDPSQPVKIGLGLLLLGAGYVFIVLGAQFNATTGLRVSMFWLTAMYTLHTLGELCLSPTGLAYVTKAAPARYVSLLMGIWFISSFLAGYGGGKIASYVEAIERGEIQLPWELGGRADFFMIFVVTSIGAGLLILLLTPFLKRILPPEERGELAPPPEDGAYAMAGTRPADTASEQIQPRVDSITAGRNPEGIQRPGGRQA